MLPIPTTTSPTRMVVGAVADEDAALVKQAQKNLAAFTELYQRHANRVYRYLVVRVGNSQDAQDLTSQTFLTAMESIGRYRGQGSFAAWLLGIARHKALDHFRQRRPQLDLDVAEELPAALDGPDELAGLSIQVEQVARKLQTLAPDRAEALSLRLFGGLEVSDIAQLMNKNEGAVRVLVHRGLQDLQVQLKPSEENER